MVDWSDFEQEGHFCQTLENDNSHWFLTDEEQKDHYCRMFANREDLEFNQVKRLIFENWKERYNLKFQCESILFK